MAASVARKLGCRVVATFGGVLYGTGLLLAALTRDVGILAVGLVVISGFGAACCLQITMAELVFYFNEKYPLAMGVSLLGAPLGMMLYGPVTQVLLDTYGWRGTMLIFGAVGFHIIPAAMLTRKPKGFQTYVQIPETNSPAVDGDHGGDSDEHKTPQRSPMRRFRAYLSTALGLEVFARKDFMILAGVRMLFSVSYSGVIVYLFSNGLSVGLSATEASFLTTAWGVGNLAGLGLATLVLHKEILSTHAAVVLASIMTRMCTALAPFIQTFHGQVVNTFIIGIGMDGIFEVILVMTRALPVSDDMLVMALGWQNFLSGVSIALGDTASGWLYDVTGTFHATFFLYSAVLVLTIVPLFIGAHRGPKYQELTVILPAFPKPILKRISQTFAIR